MLFINFVLILLKIYAAIIETIKEINVENNETKIEFQRGILNSLSRNVFLKFSSVGLKNSCGLLEKISILNLNAVAYNQNIGAK